MMSAEHNRLVEAWIAGTLPEGEERKLFRLAETDADLARLLDEQAVLESGISADRAGLRARYDGDALRSYVAELSMRTKPEGVAVEQSIGGSDIARMRSAGKWLVGLLLISGTAAGIYLAGGDAPDSAPVRNEADAVAPVETVLSPDVAVSPSVPERHANDGVGNAAGPAHVNSAATPQVVTHSAKPEAASNPVGASVSNTPATSSPPLNSHNEIEVRGEIDGNLPP